MTLDRKKYLLEQNKKLRIQLEDNIRQLTGKTLKEKAEFREQRELDKLSRMQKSKIKRYKGIVFNFQCPRCKSKNTKRSGTTTQLNKKARYFCWNCHTKKTESKDMSIKTFFVLDNKQMKEQINNNKLIDNKKRKFFIEKYTIR